MNTTCTLNSDFLQQDKECNLLVIGTIGISLMIAVYSIVFICSASSYYSYTTEVTKKRDCRTLCTEYNSLTCGCETKPYSKVEAVKVFLTVSGLFGIVGAIIGFSTGQIFVLGWFGIGLPVLAFTLKCAFEDKETYTSIQYGR